MILVIPVIWYCLGTTALLEILGIVLLFHILFRGEV